MSCHGGNVGMEPKNGFICRYGYYEPKIAVLDHGAHLRHFEFVPAFRFPKSQLGWTCHFEFGQTPSTSISPFAGISVNVTVFEVVALTFLLLIVASLAI